MVLVTKSAAEVDVYTTRNNGVTWSRHRIPDTPALTGFGYVPFSAPNANDLFAWISPYLYRSTDGGTSWSRVAAPALSRFPNQQSLSDISFANRPTAGMEMGARVHRRRRAALGRDLAQRLAHCAGEVDGPVAWGEERVIQATGPASVGWPHLFAPTRMLLSPLTKVSVSWQNVK